MKPRMLIALAATAVGLALVAAACGSETTVQAPGTENGISVSGRGEVEAPPDVAIVSVGVEVREDTVAAARERAAELAQAVIDSLEDNGVEERDIRTTSFSIQPQYDFNRDEEPRITAYIVRNTVEVTVREIDEAGDIIDDAVEAGGDDVRFQGIRFDIDDTTALVEQARELAMDDARAKAEQLADLADVGLGDPIAITESSSTAPPPIFVGRDDLAAEEGTPIEPGTASVSVSVNVVWEIE